jgi:hypothetical protein
MFRHALDIRYAPLFAALAVLPIISALSAQTPAHNHAIVEWYADLSGAKDASLGVRAQAVQTRATGKVTASFDFDHQAVTFNVEAKGITGVEKIEVRAARSRGDLSGPAIITIYDSRDGPFTGALTKTVTGRSFTQVSTPIINGQAAVVITTHTHPDGEIAGFIVMHKRYEQ